MELFLLLFLSRPLDRFCMFEFLGAGALVHFNVFTTVLEPWLQC